MNWSFRITALIGVEMDENEMSQRLYVWAPDEENAKSLAEAKVRRMYPEAQHIILRDLKRHVLRKDCTAVIHSNICGCVDG